jgi:hypothetical protein
MRPGRAEAREIERLAARESLARFREALFGECRAEPVEAGASHSCGGKPLRQAESGFA